MNSPDGKAHLALALVLVFDRSFLRLTAELLAKYLFFWVCGNPCKCQLRGAESARSSAMVSPEATDGPRIDASSLFRATSASFIFSPASVIADSLGLAAGVVLAVPTYRGSAPAAASVSPSDEDDAVRKCWAAPGTLRFFVLPC